MSKIACKGGVIVTLLGLLTVPVQSVLADAYLDALNAEATGEKSTNDESVLQSDWTHKKQSLKSQLTPGLTKPVFEAELKHSFYGSYVFYNKLNDAKKDAVYQHYNETKDIEAVRQKIMSLLSGE